MRPRFFASMIVVCVLACSSALALADTVTVYGVNNATWWENHRTYLYVYDTTAGTYGYQWDVETGSSQSGPNLPTEWTSVQNVFNNIHVNDYIPADHGWRVESGGNPFTPTAINPWITKHLAQGTYNLTMAIGSDVYNLREYTWGATTDPYLGDAVYNAYVQIWTDNGLVNTSFGDDTHRASTEAAVYAYYQSLTITLQITNLLGEDVHFYINDANSIDNGGSVTLEYNLVPLPGSLALLGPGLALLLAGNWWRRRRS